MPGRLLTLFITVFWLTMMALLARREIVPAWRAAREAERVPSYAQLTALAETPRVSQMGIHLGGRRIGQTVGVVRKEGEALMILNETRISLNLGAAPGLAIGAAGYVNLLLRFKATALDGRLASFRLVASSPPATEPLAIVDGHQVDEELSLRINQGGRTRTERIAFDPRQLLCDALSPAFTPAKLKVGEKWVVRTIDPTTYGVRTAWATVTGKERIALKDRNVEAFVITIPYGAHEVKVWADRDGQVLKQKVFGFTFVREEPSPEASNIRIP